MPSTLPNLTCAQFPIPTCPCLFLAALGGVFLNLPKHWLVRYQLASMDRIGIGRHKAELRCLSTDGTFTAVIETSNLWTDPLAIGIAVEAVGNCSIQEQTLALRSD